MSRAPLRWLLPLAAVVGCSERATSPASPEPSGRFAAVKSAAKQQAAARFCEKSYPDSGSEVRRWVPPPERPVPGAAVEAAPHAAAWTWVNLWASWCGPCLAELPLLERWKKSLNDDGVALRFEMWSIDETEAELMPALKKPMPGPVHWLKSNEDLPRLFEAFGVDRSSAIPVHALVDPSGRLRCVRVGSVGEESYGAVKTLLLGG